MEKSERILLNTAIDAIQPLITAYNVQEWSTEAINFSVVLDAVLDVACVFIPESRAREVIEEIIRARDVGISRKRKYRSLKYKINHE